MDLEVRIVKDQRVTRSEGRTEITMDAGNCKHSHLDVVRGEDPAKGSDGSTLLDTMPTNTYLIKEARKLVPPLHSSPVEPLKNT